MAAMRGLGAASMNTYNGPVPPGVPNPYTVMLHSYPTRFHGPIYTRAMYNLDWAERPNDFGIRPAMMGLGDEAVQPMQPWKVAVGIGFAALIVYGALKIADGLNVST